MMNDAWKIERASQVNDNAHLRQPFTSSENTERTVRGDNAELLRYPMPLQKEESEHRKEGLKTLLFKKNERKSSSSKRALGLLVGFLVLMLVFTLVSRSAYTLTLPQVETTKAVTTSITHKANLNGTLEANERIIIPVQQGMMIASVNVKNGDRVEKGQLLFRYDEEALAERITQASDAVAKVELSLGEARTGIEKAEQQRQASIARAQEDCEAAERSGSQSVAEAKLALEDAEVAYKAQSSSDLYVVYEEAKKTYDAAIVSMEESERLSERALEDALSAAATGYSEVESLNLDLGEAERALSKLTVLQDSSGQVFSSAEGIVRDVSIAIGSEAGGPSAMLITDSSQGYRLECVATSEQSKYLEIGDEVTVTVSGTSKGFGSTISGKTESTNQVDSFVISAAVPADYVAGSSTAQMQCSKSSSRYSDVLPIAAIVSSSDNGIKKQSIFVLEEENTVLGIQTVVRQVDVDILEQSDQYVAIEGAISQDQRVVSSSDVELKDGDRVREVSS